VIVKLEAATVVGTERREDSTTACRSDSRYWLVREIVSRDQGTEERKTREDVIEARGLVSGT